MEQKSIINLENRNHLTLSGVIKVFSFTNQAFSLETQLGNLLIKGTNLEIGNLNLDRGELTIKGKVNAITYTDAAKDKKQESLLSKLFK